MKYDLTKVWTKETAHPSYHGKWSRSNPAAGQCCVTALLMQKIHGGSIVECFVGRERHYVNIILSQWCDYTKTQYDFAAGSESCGIVYTKTRTRSRESLLSHADVRERYIQLCRNFRMVYGINPDPEMLKDEESPCLLLAA